MPNINDGNGPGLGAGKALMPLSCRESHRLNGPERWCGRGLAVLGAGNPRDAAVPRWPTRCRRRGCARAPVASDQTMVRQRLKARASRDCTSGTPGHRHQPLETSWTA